MSRSFLVSLAAALLLGVLGYSPALYADTQDDLQSQIDSQNQKIQQIQQEIAQLQTELDSTSRQKQTLQSAVSQLDLSIKKVSANISLTQSQVSRTDLQIRQLSGSIATTTTKIGDERAGIAQTLRNLQAQDEQSPAIELLGGEATLSSFFDEVATLGTLRDELGNKVTELTSLKTTLVTNKNAAEDKRNQLAAYKTQLAQQQQALAATRADKSQLLAQTKNQEASYQKLIAQKREEEARFEAELFELASGLSAADNTTAPSPRHGILRWPLSSVHVTQQFGRTSSSIRLYTSGTHDGIDLRADDGTAVRSALTGVVQEINQGSAPNCQYGKWVLVRHANGLTTLYAHLSYISVSRGQSVATGEVLGFSGRTGYATGPHLHFTVYLSQSVSFKQYTCKSGVVVKVPIAAVNGYLDPLSYLPAL